MKHWSWLLQYGITILLALLLSAILGSISLFKEASIVDTRLTASRIVQFMGYSSALILLWLLGQRAVRQLPVGSKGPSLLRHLILPFVTLIVVSAGYQVLLLIAGPFLGATGRTIYNWLFVIGIVSAALWLFLAWFLKSAPMLEPLETPGRQGQSADTETSVLCPQCHSLVPHNVKYCGQCGASVI